MSWAKYDADRAESYQGRHRSADRLAEAVKSGLGDHDAAPHPGDHRGSVEPRAVEPRAVHSRPVADEQKKAYTKARSAAVKASAAAEDAQGHREAVEAHREAARLSTTQAQRMLHEGKAAEHAEAAKDVRSKASEAVPRAPARVTRPARKAPADVRERKSTAPTAAERLVEDRDTRAKSHYEKVASRADEASREAKDEAGHAEAYRQHVHAANLAPNEELRVMHMKAAVSHDRANVYSRSTDARAAGLAAAKQRAGQPHTPVERTAEAKEYQGRADRAAYLSRKASTAADHREAAKAHTEAADAAPSAKLRTLHDKLAENHTRTAANEDKATALLRDVPRRPATAPTPKAPAEPRAVRAAAPPKAAKGATPKPAKSEYASARKTAVQLGAAAETAQEHEQAARAHLRAAEVATTSAQRAVHESQARTHEAAAAAARKR